MRRIKFLFGGLVLAGLACGGQAQTLVTNGLVAYYPFNGNANDASGNNHDGVGGAVTLVADRFGVPGAAAQFNGSNSVVTIASLSSNAVTELSISVWVLPFAAPPIQDDIVSKWRGFSYSLEDYDLALGSDLKVVFGNGRHGTGYYDLPNHCSLFSTNAVPAGKWSHIAVTLDSTGIGKLWINSVPAAQDNILQLLPPATEPIRIGQVLYTAAAPYNGAIIDSFNGLIDDVAIYNRALSDAEIQQLYATGAGPLVGLIKAVKPSFFNLNVTTNYQLQVSSNMTTWTNTGAPFTATNSFMVYPEYFDVNKWDSLFFRLQVAP